MKVSTYKDFKQVDAEKGLFEILGDIKTGKFKSDINSLRYAVFNEKESEADLIKKGLFSFTASGTFGANRNLTGLITYSQILCLDFDKIPREDLQSLVSTINACEYTQASFISPSGNGVKVFVKVNSNAENHDSAYQQVSGFYRTLTNTDLDSKTKDVARLCFVSYDPEMYINTSALVFKIKEDRKINHGRFSNIQQSDSLNSDDLLLYCLKLTEQNGQYLQGNRNNFIFRFGCNANRLGISESEALDFCISNFDLGELEIKTTVKGAYKRNIADFAKFANLAKSANIDSAENIQGFEYSEEEDFLLNTPFIPQSVYDNLPPILFEGGQAFTDQRQKDLFLTGGLSILSGCIPNVSGVYGGRKVYPNLFGFVIAPPASGKGALQSAKELADKFHSEVLKISSDQRKEFEYQMEHYKQAQRLKKKGDMSQIELPVEPPFKVVFIPANASNASIINHLQKNEGTGIICETEADTMGQAFKNDWGSYSDLLRKAFHNEKVSISRKTNSEYFEIDTPNLSVLLSGTPGQVTNIISSAEDGLFSRFIFYIYRAESIWIDPSPYGNQINLTDHFKYLSNKVHDMVLFLQDHETIVHMRREQWDILNLKFSDYLSKVSTFISDDAQSVVKRLGLITYRLCMLFSAIRKFQFRNINIDIYCTNEDFEIALELADVYLQHSILMFHNLPKQNNQVVFKAGQNKEQFLKDLPQKFLRKEAVEIAKKFSMSERTVDLFLKNCLGKYLRQPRYGEYEKID